MAVRGAGQQRDDRQKDRDGAAQPDPGDERDLAALEAERQQAQSAGDRPGQQHQRQRQHHRRAQGRHQLPRCHQQPQHQEQHDLAEPGERVDRLIDHLGRAMAEIADHQAGQIDRQEAAGADRLGAAEDGQRPGQRQDRVQPGRQAQPVDGDQQDGAPGSAQD